jgi:hypothetical protein
MTSKKIDLVSVFGVEGMVTPKTLVNETTEDVRRKKPHEMGLDIRALLDEMQIRVVSSDIEGVLSCISAAELRLKLIREEAEKLKKFVDKNKKK